MPSLLRGFSAPVCLADGFGDAELLVLMNHDTDPFNRWEAAQRLGLARILARIRGEAGDALDDPVCGGACARCSATRPSTRASRSSS